MRTLFNGMRSIIALVYRVIGGIILGLGLLVFVPTFFLGFLLYVLAELIDPNGDFQAMIAKAMEHSAGDTVKNATDDVKSIVLGSDGKAMDPTV